MGEGLNFLIKERMRPEPPSLFYASKKIMQVKNFTTKYQLNLKGVS
jgi:hypothetical protein